MLQSKVPQVASCLSAELDKQHKRFWFTGAWSVELTVIRVNASTMMEHARAYLWARQLQASSARPGPEDLAL